MELLLLLLVITAVLAFAAYSSNRTKAKQAEQSEAQLAPVRKLVDEDITALGVELQELDSHVAGLALDDGARADYQRALDDYEAAKTAVAAMTVPDQARHVTEILEDGRYAMACVRARVEGKELPVRRPPCFFDPRHGLSVTDVAWTPPDGAQRDVPACALDAERVRAGAEPDTRKVMVGAQRVPYYQGGPAYQPYAAGYYGAFGPMSWMFMGMFFAGGLGGFGGGDFGGDGGGDGGGDFGGDDGGDFGGFSDFGGFDL